MVRSPAQDPGRRTNLAVAIATQYGYDRQVHWKPPMLFGMERRDGELLLTLDFESEVTKAMPLEK